MSTGDRPTNTRLITLRLNRYMPAPMTRGATSASRGKRWAGWKRGGVGRVIFSCGVRGITRGERR